MTAAFSPGVRPPRPLVYAHRGGRALAPENTIAAFDRGLAAGADGLELDVRLSGDGIPVVHHDPDLDRCTSAAGLLAALTAVQLSRVDAGHHFAPEHGHPWRGRGIGVPTLDSVLERYPRTPIIVEIKTYTREAAQAVVQAVDRANARAHVCLCAFHRATLEAVRGFAPDLATGAAPNEVRWAMYGAWFGLRPRRCAYRAVQVPETVGRTRIVTPQLVRRLHDSDIAVQVWTVNDEPDMRRLLDWGVDGLITDRPDLAAAVRDRWCAERHP